MKTLYVQSFRTMRWYTLGNPWTLVIYTFRYSFKSKLCLLIRAVHANKFENWE
jgi:hypothetical protein